MKHIIWDFNGTLLDDTRLSVDVDNLVFARLGLPAITIEDYRRHMTMPVRGFYTALGVDYAVHPYELISRIWLDAFNANAVSVGLAPGMQELVRRLYAQGVTQSVLSATYEPSLREQCGALGLDPYMADIAGRQDERADKKTEIAREQLARLGLCARQTVLVGDMATDAELAQELGAACVLVSWGHNDEERLRATGCPIAENARQLEELLAGME